MVNEQQAVPVAQFDVGAKALFDETMAGRFAAPSARPSWRDVDEDEKADWRGTVAAIIEAERLTSHPCKSGEGAGDSLDIVFREDVLVQASRLGMAPKANETPGSWRDRVRETALRSEQYDVVPGSSWAGDPNAVASELRRVANRFREGFRLPQLLRDAADEIDCLTDKPAALTPDATQTREAEGARIREIAEAIYAEVADEPLGDLTQRRQAVQDTWHDAVRAALSGGEPV